MTNRRSKAYVWSECRKDLRKNAELRDFHLLTQDIIELVWATIYCRTSTRKVGDAYPALRESLRNFKAKWGENNLFYALEEMRFSPIGFYNETTGGFLLPVERYVSQYVVPKR